MFYFSYVSPLYSTAPEMKLVRLNPIQHMGLDTRVKLPCDPLLEQVTRYCTKCVVTHYSIKYVNNHGGHNLFRMEKCR
jgi:hypothetical protein